MSEQQRYPLSWPRGWRRVPPSEREHATFAKHSTQSEMRDGQAHIKKTTRALSVADAVTRLETELDRLGATDAILSTNIRLRMDGSPDSRLGDPPDPGAAVYFKLAWKPLCLACDKWTRVADNIAALAQHIDALRRIERYGVGRLEQAFAGYAALPASPHDWWIILGVTPDATSAQVDDAYRRLARTTHPDAGGTHDQMARLNAARDEAQKAGR